MKRTAVAGVGAMLMAVAVGLGAAGAETYVGTVTVPQEGAGPVSVPLTLTVRQQTSDERANALAQLLHKRGHAAAAAEMAKDDVGQLQLGDQTFRVTVVRQEPTANGQVMRAITDRALHFGAKTSAPSSPADAVGYVELTLGAAGPGEGRLMPAIRTTFDAEGYIAADNIGGVTWTAAGVKRKP